MGMKIALPAVVAVVLIALIGGLVGRGVGRAFNGSDIEVSAPNKSAKVVKNGPPNFLHTEGSKIVDSYGNEVRLTGVNWFGTESGTFVPHGLWERNWESMLDQISELGYNTIRLPYCNEMFDPRSLPDGIDYKKNPDLHGLSSIEVMDKIIEGAGQRGLKVILDRHRPDIKEQSRLWYTDKYDEERWINDWKILAERYRGNDTVIGADLHNEPHEKATWGTGDPKTDWKMAAEKAGNAILSVNPDWLIFVEGIEVYNGDWFWWGANLKGVADNPIHLNVPNKVVYSPHEYGPGVWSQSWFKDPDYPSNLPKIWDKYWGYIVDQGIAPVMVGEFGGRRVDDSSLEGKWQRAFLSYMKQKGISYTYWAFNANSGNTGGILDEEDENWETIDKAKQDLLSTYLWPKIPVGQASVVNARAVPDYSTDTTRRAKMDGDLRVQYRPGIAGGDGERVVPEMRIVNVGTTPIPLEGLELRYWLTVDGGSGDSLRASVPFTSAGNRNVDVKLEKSGEINNGEVLKIQFTKDAGSILGRGGVVEVQAEVSADDGSLRDQSNDYSFDKDRDPDRARDFEIWEKIGLYSNGKLIWGAEPQRNT